MLILFGAGMSNSKRPRAKQLPLVLVGGGAGHTGGEPPAVCARYLRWKTCTWPFSTSSAWPVDKLETATEVDLLAGTEADFASGSGRS